MSPNQIWTVFMKLQNIPFLLAITLLMACGDNSGGDQNPRSVDGKADTFSQAEVAAFEEFRDSLYCEPDGGPCIVQGDVPIWGDDALKDYYLQRKALLTGLTVMSTERVDAIWDRTERYDLTFCVSDGFGARKDEVVEAMVQSSTEWEAIADVDLRYLPEHDARCNNRNAQVVFNVRPTDDPFARYIARAFFPNNTERARREVLVNLESHDGMFESDQIGPEYTLTGVMRHELGHVLGFRHEHIRDESDAFFCFEDDDFRPVTEYDASSVMHYPQCNGEGDWGLALTQVDARGASFFYPDFDEFTAARCDSEVLENGQVDPTCQPVVHQILELANKGTFDVLDNWVRLDVRAVEEMVELRDSRPFNTLEDLRAIRYFEQVGIKKMYDYLYVNGRCPLEVDGDGLVHAQCKPVVNRILELANRGSQDELDHAVRLDSRAAANIAVIREHRPFASFEELWHVDYVKARAFLKMYNYLYEDGSR
jgi:hypothetical protein